MLRRSLKSTEENLSQLEKQRKNGPNNLKTLHAMIYAIKRTENGVRVYAIYDVHNTVRRRKVWNYCLECKPTSVVNSFIPERVLRETGRVIHSNDESLGGKCDGGPKAIEVPFSVSCLPPLSNLPPCEIRSGVSAADLLPED